MMVMMIIMMTICLRQASFRGLGKLSDSSPFKRQFSLRLNELPSTLARQARDSGEAGATSVSQFSPIKEDAGDDLGDLLSPNPTGRGTILLKMLREK